MLIITITCPYIYRNNMYWIIIILEFFFVELYFILLPISINLEDMLTQSTPYIIHVSSAYKYKPGSHKPNPLSILYPINRFHLIPLPVCIYIYIYPSTCIPIFLSASISLYEQMYVHSANIDVVYCWGKIIYTMYVQFFSGCVMEDDRLIKCQK